MSIRRSPQTWTTPAQGIPIAGYHFPEPDNATDAVDEATFFYNTIKSRLYAGNMRPMLDMENEGSLTTKAEVSAWTNLFCTTFQNLSGITPIIYAGQSFASTYLNTSVIDWPLWIAKYPSSTVDVNTSVPGSTTPWSTWHFWQYTSSGSVSGVSGNVDRDIFNGDVAALEAYKITNTTAGTLTGTLFRDNNDDFTRQATEPLLAGRTVYLDLNNDGTLNANEPSTTTNASGVYTFSGLKPGGYSIRQVLPTGWITTSSANTLPRLTMLVAGSTQTQNFGSRPSDVTPPAVSSITFNRINLTLAVQFSEAMDASSFASTDLSVIDTASSAPMAVTYQGYNTVTRTATFSLAPAPFATGSFAATLVGGSVADAFDNVLASASTLNFGYQQGDVDGDLRVNFSDLLLLASSYGSTGATVAQGDLNYDGAVNFSDLLLLASNYGAGPAAAAASVGSAAAPGTVLRRPDDEEVGDAQDVLG
ncbi:MAG: GH25 family lysozyme [Tepidisphaeraceae bacterium]